MEKIVGLIGGFLAVVTVLCFLLAFPFMWLWNYAVVAAITIANPISYWPAFCLMLFLSLFFAGSSSSRKSN